MDKIYDISIEGIGKIAGGAYKDISIEGIGTIVGNIIGYDINVEGVGSSKGNIDCNYLSVEGTFKCKGNVEVVDKIKVSGCVTIRGNCQCRELYCNGKLDIDELLSADKITLIIEATNRIKEIGGEDIRVIAGGKSMIGGMFYSKKLVSDTIEGDNIILENTECKMVRGNNITINSGCNIDTVEYSGDILIDKKSKVKNIIKV